jgi:hypothetical protein
MTPAARELQAAANNNLFTRSTPTTALAHYSKLGAAKQPTLRMMQHEAVRTALGRW